ncbi:MAG: hypothetical protein RRZ24_11005 [Clostridia bacterium]
MRGKSKSAPAGAFVIEPIENHSGLVRIRFFADPKEVVDTHWAYDEYQIVLPDRADLSDDISGNYETWLEAAMGND